MNRKSCSNVPTALYSGSEKSPLGLGLSAEGFENNYEMMGIDKLMWVVNLKNNKKVWVRKYTNNSITHEKPLINEEIINNTNDVSKINEEEKPVMKKISNYNLFLNYNLKKLKENNPEKLSNKELFAKSVEEWNKIKKNPTELNKILELINSQ